MTTIPSPATRRPVVALVALFPAVLALLVATPAHPAAAGVLAPPGVPVTAVGPPVLAAHPPSPDATARHLVAPGETLSGIAATRGTSISALAVANGLSDPDHVLAGTTLVVPGRAAGGSGGGGSGLPARLASSPSRVAYLPVFEAWAAANGIPADLLKAMTWLESGWQNHLVSPTGAVGIGQLMPDTVDFVELLIGADLDPSDPEDNIRMAARYLRWLLHRHATTADALASYYQGPASVARHGTFAETDAYVADVLALRDRF